MRYLAAPYSVREPMKTRLNSIVKINSKKPNSIIIQYFMVTMAVSISGNQVCVEF